MLDINGKLDRLPQTARDEVLLLGYDEDKVKDSLRSHDGESTIVVTDRRVIVSDAMGTSVLEYSEVTSVELNRVLVLNTELGSFELSFNGEEHEQVAQFARWLRQLVDDRALRAVD